MNNIYWIEDAQPPRFAIAARPRTEDDLISLKKGGLDVLVSLVEPEEAEELGLGDEAMWAQQQGLRFISYPIPDRSTPADLPGFLQLVSELCDLIQAGQKVGAHCQGCIGRSTVLVASIMITLGATAEEALSRIEQARGCVVPDTAEQREWIRNFQPGRIAAVSRLVFPHRWEAEILPQRPLILPPRHFTYPREAEEVERGALELLVRPASDAPFLATFALGFADPAAPTGLWSCPNPDELCALSGGYAYILDTRDPRQCTRLGLQPVLEVRPLPEHRLLLFAGHQALLAWSVDGLAWQSPRLSSEGLRLTEIRGDQICGVGWDLLTDREIPFVVDLKTGAVLSEPAALQTRFHSPFRA